MLTSDGFFSDDELSRWRASLSPVRSPPPRSASSSSRVTTDEILMEIDSSMSHTLHTIDNEVDTRVVRKKKPPRTLPDSRPRENGYRSVPEEQRMSVPEEQRIQQSQDTKLYREVTDTTITSTEIADKFSGLMSGAESPDVRVRPAEKATGTISPEILQAIREQMAVSLQRMRELEDQVRLMPVMEDQISKLRDENKRLYHLLSKLTEDHQARDIVTVNGESGLFVEGDENIRTFRGEEGSVLVELPVTVGKEQVERSSYSMQSTTETRTEIRESNASARRSFFWGTDADDTAGMSPEKLRLFKPSRTIGVGDGNVFETGGLVERPAWRKTRDVGVHCLPASRDVSVSVAEAASEEELEENGSGGARVSLTVTVSDERRVCEPRWEVERFGSGLYQSVAVQCLIIGGFLTSDRPHMSENVDGWLVERNKLWTYSADDELAALSSFMPTRLEQMEPRAEEEQQYTASAGYMSSKDSYAEDQSISAVKVERESATLNRVLEKLYRTKAESEVDSDAEDQSISAVKVERESGLERNKLWTYSADDELAALSSFMPTRLEQMEPRAEEEQQYTASAGYVSSKDSYAEDQSISAVRVERESATLNKVLEKLYRTKPESEVVDDVIKEEKTVSARANPSAIDLNASYRKLQATAETEDDQMVKEDIIVAHSKPQASASCTVNADLKSCYAKLQEVQEPVVSEDAIVPKSAEPRASSRHVEKLAMEDVVNKQVSSGSRLTGRTEEAVIETSFQHDEKESSVDSTGVQPFPPHLSRITASSVDDDDALSDQQQQHDVTAVETTSTHSVTVVKESSSCLDEQSSSAAVEQQVPVPSVLPDQTSSMSEGVVVTRSEVTEVTKVTVESEFTSEGTTSSLEEVSTSITSGDAQIADISSQEMIDKSHTTSIVVVSTEIGDVESLPTSDEMGSVDASGSDVAKSESTPVSHQEIVSTTQDTESTVVSTEVSDVQQSPGEVIPAMEASDIMADMATDQSQGCHIVITETRVERQLIGSDLDQSQPVVTVPGDTIIQ